eukprot:GFUD01016639.1.p1 GENE.GFUD01016639.1~~GFUD01016639.1.p1  ORF type:complete len:210 (+),score=34.96 GFUD01016639.1:89-718(+)
MTRTSHSRKLKDRKHTEIKKTHWKQQFRDQNGRFGAARNVKKSVLASLNTRDFNKAKVQLFKIQNRNLKSGVSVDFKIVCKKFNRKAPSKSFNWKSTNFVDEDPPPQENSVVEDPLGEEMDNVQNLLEGDEPKTYEQLSKSTHLGLCIICHLWVAKNDWRSINCKHSRCIAGLVHLRCLGFPDVSVELSSELRSHYQCRTCAVKTRTVN